MSGMEEANPADGGWDEMKGGRELSCIRGALTKTGTSLVEDRAQCHSLVSSEDYRVMIQHRLQLQLGHGRFIRESSRLINVRLSFRDGV